MTANHGSAELGVRPPPNRRSQKWHRSATCPRRSPRSAESPPGPRSSGDRRATGVRAVPRPGARRGPARRHAEPGRSIVRGHRS